MDFNQYFCNLYQAYLMATNSFKISNITTAIYKAIKEYNDPAVEVLYLISNEQPKTIIISINTNYKKSYTHTLKDIYYHASEIEVHSFHERYYHPLYSIVKESKDRKTLLITRRILL